MTVTGAFKKAASYCWDSIRGGRLTLLEALEKGDWGKAGAMLQQNPEAADWDLQGPTPIVRKPLHVAASSGDFNTLSILLRAEFFKGDIDIRDSEGATPLILAARTGNDLILKALIAKGADVNAMDKHGNSAISQAAGLNRVASMQVLIAHGANVNGPPGGKRPINATTSSSMQLPALQLLIAKNADLDTPDRYNETPLKTCRRAPNWESFDVLLRAGANPNKPDKEHGAQLLHWAIRGNRADIVEALLKKGVDPTVAAGYPTSVVEEAHADGRNPVITAMIDRRAQQLTNKRATEAAIKEMTAGTAAAISVKPIKLRIS